LTIHVIREGIDVGREFITELATVILQGTVGVEPFDLLERVHRDEHMADVSLNNKKESEQRGKA
jgi:hypothetical protein